MKLGHKIEESRARWPEITDSMLEELEIWGTERSLGKIPAEQLAIFAHSCYYDKSATLRCMDTYYRLRATVPEFFRNRDILLPGLQQSMTALYCIDLPIPDEEGNCIIFHGLANYSPSSYVFDEALRLLMMTIDASLYRVGCVPGHKLLFDMRGVKLTHLLRLSILSLRRFFEYLQEGLPVRLKAIHVINCVWFVDKVLALVKPFMSKELLDILHLHTADVSEVYRYIPPECLPKDFGGQLDDLDTLNAEQRQRFIELRSYFFEEEQLYRGYRSTPTKSTATEDVAIEDIS